MTPPRRQLAVFALGLAVAGIGWELRHPPDLDIPGLVVSHPIGGDKDAGLIVLAAGLGLVVVVAGSWLRS